VSIDIGLSNAAWVHMDRDHNVLAWKQTNISKPKPYNPASLKPQVRKSLLCIIISLFSVCSDLEILCEQSQVLSPVEK